jgi:hypothetical protein
MLFGKWKPSIGTTAAKSSLVREFISSVRFLASILFPAAGQPVMPRKYLFLPGKLDKVASSSVASLFTSFFKYFQK